MKFGGSSVASSEARLTSSLRVISAKEQGYFPVVVVSAIGRAGAPYATESLLNVLHSIDASVSPDPRETDLLLACGEILSAVIFAHTLKTLGHPAQAFRGEQAGIRTDGVYGNARIISINPQNLVASLEKGFIPVICGFQGEFVGPGLGPAGELTTLGRGGSDTTGAAIGAALRADAVEIYTDVDGVKTADPDYVKNAPTLRKVTYDEVAEIAHLGARVVHPRAAEIAMRYSIPLWVKNTFSDDEGTEIVPRSQFPGRRVTGVTHTGKLVYLQFDFREVDEGLRLTIEGHIYDTLALYAINLFMLNLSPTSTGFAVPRDQYPLVQDVFDGLVIPLIGESGQIIHLFQIGSQASKEVMTQASFLKPIENVKKIVANLTEGCTLVSLVGHDYMQQAGVFLAVLETLQQTSINVLQTSDSDTSVSVLIPESETHRAVRVLHERFGLDGAI